MQSELQFMVAAIIAAGFGFIVAKDAERRGMNPLFWGLGTFFLLIVFLPLYILIKKPEYKQEIKTQNEE
jgi:hypothetical protein